MATIKVSQVTEIEVDVSLPHYTKFGHTHYRIDGEKSCLSVTQENIASKIERHEYIPSAALSIGVPCTSDEFYAAYAEVVNKFKNSTH